MANGWRLNTDDIFRLVLAQNSDDDFDSGSSANEEAELGFFAVITSKRSVNSNPKFSLCVARCERARVFSSSGI